MTDLHLLDQLRSAVERRLDWPPPATWSAAHFEELSDRIAEATEIRLSVTTLKRVWGRVSYSGRPSRTTLNTLARFAGSDGWVAFAARYRASDAPAVGPPPVPSGDRVTTRSATAKYWWLAVPLVAAILIVATSLATSPGRRAAAVERFTFDPIATGLPNTVQFRYALSGEYDSVEIQQSWDERLRYRVDPDNGFHASTYYYPGVYQAKLVVDGAVAEERTLVVPSGGWLGTQGADKASAPIYLPVDSIRTSDGKLRIPTVGQVATQELHYITEKGLTFNNRTDIRTRFQTTTGAVCESAELLLFYEKGVVVLPFSTPGCTGNLRVYAMGRSWSGRDHDLAGFGVSSGEWINLRVRQNQDSVSVTRSEKAIFSLALPRPAGRLMGVRYSFEAGGAVDEAVVNGRNLLQ